MFRQSQPITKSLDRDPVEVALLTLGVVLMISVLVFRVWSLGPAPISDTGTEALQPVAGAPDNVLMAEFTHDTATCDDDLELAIAPLLCDFDQKVVLIVKEAASAEKGSSLHEHWQVLCEVAIALRRWIPGSGELVGRILAAF